MDPTEKELVVMQYAERKGVNMRPEELRMFTNIFGVRAFLLDPHRPSPLRMCNYIVKQAEKDRRKKLNDLVLTGATTSHGADTSARTSGMSIISSHLTCGKHTTRSTQNIGR